MPHYNAWIIEQFAPWLCGRVIEVGAGIGNSAAAYLPHVTSAVLVEPAVNLAPRLRKRFEEDSRVTVASDLLADLDPSLHQPPFDAAIMINVLEHIEDDGAVLRQLHSVLRPNGAVCIFVPALPALYGTLDVAFDHVRRYRRAELGQKLQEAGFKVEKLRYLDSAGIAVWWFVGRILKKRRIDGSNAKLYDLLAVPVLRYLERQVTLPLGKSLVAVGVRAAK